MKEIKYEDYQLINQVKENIHLLSFSKIINSEQLQDKDFEDYDVFVFKTKKEINAFFKKFNDKFIDTKYYRFTLEKESRKTLKRKQKYVYKITKKIKV